MRQNIAVVLVTFNRIDKLKIALECYEKQTYPISEVIVVDNCSTDGTVDFLKQWEKRNAFFEKKVLFLAENTGGAGGFGYGMDFALKRVREKDLNVEWLLVSDDDAFPEPDAIEKLINYYDALPIEAKNNVVSLSGSVINNGNIHESHRSRVVRKISRVRFVGVSKKEYVKQSFDIDLFSYVGTMIKVSALQEAGTTNKELFIYGDDNEHSLRLKKIGRLVCVPSSRFIHNTAGVENRAVGWYNYYNRRNQLYILKQYFPLRYFYFRLIKRMIFDESVLSKYSKEERMLFRSARRDAMRENLGIHPIYKPGFNIRG